MGTCTVVAVSRSVWQPHADRIFRALPHETARVGRVILNTLHNRHVGITPELAGDLAGWLTDTESGERKGIWRYVFERLANEARGSSIQTIGAHGPGMMPGTAPLYSVLRLAMPLIDEACRRTGHSYVYCEDEDPHSPAAADLTVYAEKIHRAVVGLTRDEDPDGFWFDRAMTLADMSRRPGAHLSAGSPLPQSDLQAASMMRHLQPEVATRLGGVRHRKPLKTRQQHRETVNAREGGIDGIRMSRRMEDMGDMLLSEFINHPVILADRLLNSGYMVHRRRPRREKMRDVLVMGLLPGGIPQIMRAFVKACWFDLVARLSWMLARNGLIRSEFRWMEGDAAGFARAQTFLLQDLPIQNMPNTDQPDPQWRHRFMKSLGWLPPYLDLQARFQPLPARTDPGSSGWIIAALRNQRENPRWSMMERQRTGKGAGRFSDAFAHVHIMNLIDAASAPEMEDLQRAFRLSKLSPGTFSITTLPETVNVSQEWSFAVSGKPPVVLFTDEDQKIHYRQLAGRLIGAWLEQLVKEIWRV